MREYTGTEFIKEFITDKIMIGERPTVVTEPCLIHGLFPELKGKEHTTNILIDDVISESDLWIVPKTESSDESDIYQFVLDRLEKLEGCTGEMKIQIEYINNIKRLTDRLIPKYADRRSALIPIINRIALVAMFSDDDNVQSVFTKEAAFSLLRNNKAVISFIHFVEDYLSDIEYDNPMWCAELVNMLAEYINV